MNKYRNRKTTIAGIKFDSKKEGLRYLELLQLQNNGKIQHLERQKKFDLFVTEQKICSYIADFTYYKNSLKYVVEDVKSAITKKLPVYKIKKNLMKAIYGIQIKEI